MLIKQELDAWLDQVSYTELNSTELFPEHIHAHLHEFH